VLVPSDFTLYELHKVIQAVMPWAGYHLYQFTIASVDYGDPSPEDMYPMKAARRYRLNQLVPRELAKFLYTYDFGDNWEHEILVEKVLPPEPGARYPLCIAGKRACPPDDCGGPWGYAELLEALADPEHEEHEEMLEWVGGELDPEAFDLEEANAVLGHIK